MLGQTILSSPVLDEKLLKALLMLLSLRGIVKGFIIGAFLVITLFFFTMVADALCEITSHLAALWGQSDSITRLLLLCLAVYIIRKLSPFAVLLLRKGL